MRLAGRKIGLWIAGTVHDSQRTVVHDLADAVPAGQIAYGIGADQPDQFDLRAELPAKLEHSIEGIAGFGAIEFAIAEGEGRARGNHTANHFKPIGIGGQRKLLFVRRAPGGDPDYLLRFDVFHGGAGNLYVSAVDGIEGPSEHNDFLSVHANLTKNCGKL